MKIFLDFLYIYIFVYSLFFIFLTLKSLKNKKFKIIKKYDKNVPTKNLCLIIYTHNNEQKLQRIMECLKEQDYPQENMSIFVIMDCCDDNSENIVFAPNVQKFVIKNKEFIGKKEAISILIEKIKDYTVVDAFVFLDINRYIEKDFLSSINSSLQDYGVVSGATILFGENLNIRQRIKAAYQKYKMNFILRARACADLFTIIDSDVCAIKRELVDTLNIPDFENLESDLEYSLLVAKEGLTFTFNPNIKTYCEVDDFKIRIPRMSKRFSLFMNNLGNLFTVNMKLLEFILFLIAPSVVFTILSYTLLAFISLKGTYFADFSTLILLICGVILAFALSLFNSKMRFKEVLALIFYPVYSFVHFVKHFCLWRFIGECFGKNYDLKCKEEKFEVDVEITNGTAVAPCKLILINECGMSKVKFVYRNKKFVSTAHLRTFDAIEEILGKLAEHGVTIKICQGCSNFTSDYDGSTNLIKGFCKKQFQVSQNGELPVVIWSTCRGFSPKVELKNK